MSSKTVLSGKRSSERLVGLGAGDNVKGAQGEQQMAIELLVSMARLRRALKQQPIEWPEEILDKIRQERLSPRHISLLLQVVGLGRASVSELARCSGMSLATASSVAAQLAKAELVERHEDPEDHRRTMISIASGHQGLVNRFVEMRLNPLCSALGRMGAERAGRLIEAICMLAENLESERGSQHVDEEGLNSAGLLAGNGHLENDREGSSRS
jgi:DNA-binding MarR family transcriptional regulator